MIHHDPSWCQELDFYTNNFWIFGGTTVILAGFSLAQLTREIPVGTNPALEYLEKLKFAERDVLEHWNCAKRICYILIYFV